MGKLEAQHPADGNAEWCSHFGNSTTAPQKIKKIELLYDPAFLFMEHTLDKREHMSTHTLYVDVCSSLFIVVPRVETTDAHQQMNK